jgi:hypothetical protein
MDILLFLGYKIEQYQRASVTMPIECPRCLLTNPDTSYSCECGYDLVSHAQKRGTATSARMPRLESRGAEFGMSKEGFVLGIVLLWMVLTVGEWLRMRPELASRKPIHLLSDSILLSATDMTGALIIGALGWMVVWIILAYEGRRLRPCPKRTTLGVTVVAAGLLFISRWIAPDIHVQHVVHAVVVLGIAVFSYYAGTRQWLGKW